MTLVRRITRHRPLGLFYHAVSERRLPHIANLYSCRTPAEFERHVLFLKRRFDIVTPRELVAATKSGGALPEHPAFITFDDGLAECFTVARPILLKHGVPCLFFVCNDFIDNRRIYHRHLASLCIETLRSLERQDATHTQPVLSALGRLAGRPIDSTSDLASWILSLAENGRPVIDRAAELLGVDSESYLRSQRPYLTSEQVSTLVADGFQVGAHSLGHRRLNGLTAHDLSREIVTSCRLLRSTFDLATVSFSFPFSGEDIDREHLRTVLESNRFIDLFFDSGGLVEDEPYVLQRIWAEESLQAGVRPSRLNRILKRAVLERWKRSVRRALGHRA